MWVGSVFLVILAAFVAWALSASKPIDYAIGNSTSQSHESTQSSTTTRLAAQGVAHASPKKTRGKTVGDIIASLSGASRFEAMLRASGVSQALTKQGSYTVFVPVNRAFTGVSSVALAGLSRTEEKRLVEYHVVEGRALDVTAQTSGAIGALSGDQLNFMNQGVPIVNNSRIVAEYEGSNGIVYLVDNVLLPPQRSGV